MERKISKWFWLTLLPGVIFWVYLAVWYLLPYSGITVSYSVAYLGLIVVPIGLFGISLIASFVCLVQAVFDSVLKQTSYHWWLATLGNLTPAVFLIPILLSWLESLMS
jgi:hypothetical protein